jgi:hypothetical protein
VTNREGHGLQPCLSALANERLQPLGFAFGTLRPRMRGKLKSKPQRLKPGSPPRLIGTSELVPFPGAPILTIAPLSIHLARVKLVPFPCLVVPHDFFVTVLVEYSSRRFL